MSLTNVETFIAIFLSVETDDRSFTNLYIDGWFIKYGEIFEAEFFLYNNN